MATGTAAVMSQHVQWSRWFRCESSFDLTLVPEAPGLYAVGREEPPGHELTILRIEAVENLFYAMNGLFSNDCPCRAELQQGRCYLRYAEVADAVHRSGTLKLLEDWMAGRVPPDVTPGIVQDFLATNSFAPRPYRGASD